MPKRKEPFDPAKSQAEPVAKKAKRTKKREQTLGEIQRETAAAIVGLDVAMGARPVEQAMSMDDAKERAVAELGRYAKQTWEEYGVPETALGEEMTRTVTVSIDDTGKHFEERQKGIGVTLNMNLEKRKVAILEASGLATLSAALKKAKDSVHTAALYLWALGKARGPASQDNLAKLAKKAENLAEHLEKLGDGEAADRQRERAVQIRAGNVPVKEKKAERQPRPCLCGCGKLTRGSFAPGHDSKVHSVVLKIARGQLKGTMPKEVVEYVKQSTWLTNVELENFIEVVGGA